MQNHAPRKRVEYQKYLRVKLESDRYRGLFGLSDNIYLAGEEDLVLPREFRIDFVFEKHNTALTLEGIFVYFKHYNLCEFKSVNDPLTLLLLDKYIGQLFQWLFAKNIEALARKSPMIRHEEVTLTIVTVRYPREVVRHLRTYGAENGFHAVTDGHYSFNLIGVQVHILVINELPVELKNYAWLIFAEGEKRNAYTENLAHTTVEDSGHEIYYELLEDLEKEGKENVATDAFERYLARLPVEKQAEMIQRHFTRLSAENLKTMLEQLSPDLVHKIREVCTELDKKEETQ
jgi:hypothetical protein